MEKFINMIEEKAYEWACGKITNKAFKLFVDNMDFHIDLRQPNSNIMDITHNPTGNIYQIEI